MPGPGLRVVHRTPLLPPADDEGWPRYSIGVDGAVAIAWRRAFTLEVVVVGPDQRERARASIAPVVRAGSPEVAIGGGRVFVLHRGWIYALDERAPQLELVRTVRVPELPPSDVGRPEGIAGGWSGRSARPRFARSEIAFAGGRLILPIERDRPRWSPELCLLSLSPTLGDAHADCLAASSGPRFRIWRDPPQVRVRYDLGLRREARVHPTEGVVEIRELEGPAPEREDPPPAAFRALAAIEPPAPHARRGGLALQVIGDHALALTVNRRPPTLWAWRLDARARVVDGFALPFEHEEGEHVSLHAVSGEAVLVLAGEERTRVCTLAGACDVLAEEALEVVAASTDELLACGTDRCTSWSPGGTSRTRRFAPAAEPPLIARCDGAWLLVRPGGGGMHVARLDAPSDVLRILPAFHEVQIRGERSFAVTRGLRVVDACAPGESLGMAGGWVRVLLGADGVAVYSLAGAGHYHSEDVGVIARGPDWAPVAVTAYDVQLDARGRLWGLDPSGTTVLVIESRAAPLTLWAPTDAPPVEIREHPPPEQLEIDGR